MALYTKKGDSGTTTTFGCDQRMSKSSAIAEALGVLDECNSFLGVVRTQENEYKDIIFNIQNTLFTIQAEVAGSDKVVQKEKVEELEVAIANIEKQLPEIKSFFIPGASKLGAYFDFARTLARRAERRVVGVHDESVQKIGEYTLAYLNRLSSFLYALTRLASKQEGVEESSPDYK